MHLQLRSVILSTLAALAPFLPVALANVEKTIFVAPEATVDPAQHPALSEWYLTTLPTLTNSTTSIRTHINAEFPSASLPSGTETWFLLDNLNPGQRYEVRICWAATQPTAFTLDTYPLSQVLDTPDLLTSLSAYSTSQYHASDPSSTKHHTADHRPTSKLLLRILAAADYFTDDASLMKDPPPVHADVILDPFILNVLPRSLLPTVGYIALLLPVLWTVARVVSRRIEVVAKGSGDAREPKKTK